MINNIENQVETAAVYVTKGKDSIKKAVVYSRKNRRVCHHGNAIDGAVIYTGN